MTTLIKLLYGELSTARTDLESKLVSNDLLRGTPGATVVPRIAETLVAFLDRPVGNLAMTAYDKHRLIERAKRETLVANGTRQVVELARHTIERSERPKVELEISRVPTTVLELELAAKMTIETMKAVVEFGRVTRLTPGTAEVSVTLSAGGVELAKAEHQLADLSASFD